MKVVLPAILRGRKLVFWVAAGLATAALSVMAVLWWMDQDFDHGPIYKGVTAKEWFTAMQLITEGPGSSNNVVEAFRAMGPDGVSFLGRMLTMPTRERIGRNIYYTHPPPEWLGERLEKVFGFSEEVNERRQRAAWFLAQLGPAAEPALPEMLRVFRREDNYDPVTQTVRDAFQGMGSNMAFMVPELIQGLKDTNEEHSAACAKILGALGQKAKPALPALLIATNGGCWLAEAAAFALWDLDHRTNVVVEVLDRELKSRAQNRLWALQDLQRRGADLKAAAAVAPQALYDARIRDEAEKTLQQLDPELLQTTINQLNRNASLILQQTVAALESGTPITPQAFVALQYFGPKAESAVPALIEILRATPPGLVPYIGHGKSRQAAMVISAIGPGARAAVPALIMLVSNKTADAEIYCNALGSIGPDASNAIPILESLVNARKVKFPYGPAYYSDSIVRFQAASALLKIAPGRASNAVSVLREIEKEQVKYFLKEPAPSMPSNITGVESRYGERLRFPLRLYPSAPALSAQAALWQAGMEENSPITNLMFILSEVNDISATLKATKLLGEIGPKARPALPLLETFLKPNDPQRWDAAIAIERIDPDEAKRLGLPGLLLAY